MNHTMHVEFTRHDGLRILQCDTCARRLAIGGDRGYESLDRGDPVTHSWSSPGVELSAEVQQ